MNQQVKRWGNSAAVRISASTLAAAGLKLDDPIEVREDGDRIIIEKAKREDISLKSLLAKVTPENIHAEFNWGPAVGKEIW